MGSIIQDLGYAVRALKRSPGFTMAALGTLAMGIGATTAIFSVANGVLLKPLPYRDPEGLVTLWTSWDANPGKVWVSVPEFQLFHQENRTLEDLALYGSGSGDFTAPDNPERVPAAAVTPNLFSVLGVEPVVGRVFTWDEARDSVAVVLVGHDVWTRRYGGNPDIVGQSVELDGKMRTILGVLPEGFRLPVDYALGQAAQVYYPAYADLESPAPALGDGGVHGWNGVGRLRDGVTLEEARSDFRRIMAQVEPIGLYSPERQFRPRLFMVRNDIVGDVRGTILVLLGAVAFVLLIACGNVANLLLSRAEGRTAEMAVRIAFGAGRGRVVRQLFTESLVLALAAGAAGLVLARVGVGTLLSIDPDAIPRADGVALDGTVVLFTLGVSLLAAAAFGLSPALRLASAGITGSLREGGRSGTRSNRLQSLLVSTQMAMAVILLTGSGLMVRTLVGMLSIDPGFNTEDILTVRIGAWSRERYPDAPSVEAFYRDVLRRVREIPGVRSAGAARLLPLASTMGDSYFRPVGYEPRPNEGTQADWQWITPGYVESMGLHLVAGRTFDDGDRRDGQSVVMINEALAERYWGSESPLGKAVVADGAQDTAIVVGVLANVSHNGITGERRTRYYLPHAQIGEGATETMRGMTLTIATEGEPRRVLPAVRREIHAVDPSTPLDQVQTMDEVVSTSMAQPRFVMVLLGVFAAAALTLALVGIYSVLAYAVSRRTKEIGLRMALGAEGGAVVRMVVRQGMSMAGIGVAAGAVVAWFMTRAMAGLLYGVTPQDPATFLSVPALFLLVACLACTVPAVRAAHVPPAGALRHE